MERLFRRAGLRLGMSEGFHPKPRMSFPLALALGMEGLDEVVELELAEPCVADDLLGRLRTHTVPGLGFCSVETLPNGAKKAQPKSVTYQMVVPEQFAGDAARGSIRLCAMSTCPVQRPKKHTVVDVRRSLETLEFKDGVLEMRLALHRESCAGPREVLAALGLDGLEQAGVHLTRTRVELRP
jgi:radical SAM-linked protein